MSDVDTASGVAASAGSAYPKEHDFALTYAGKFWDAGNLVVTLMFSLAFGVYYLASQHPEVRDILQDRFPYLVVLAIIGNGGLWFLLVRLYRSEMVYVEVLTAKAELRHTVWKATRARIALLIFNTVMYVAVLALNYGLHVHSPVLHEQKPYWYNTETKDDDPQ